MYDSFVVFFIMLCLNEIFFITLLRVIFYFIENVNFLMLGLSEYRFLYKSLGNIGKMVCMRYVVVFCFFVLVLSGVLGLMKCDTSAMCTSTFR